MMMINKMPMIALRLLNYDHHHHHKNNNSWELSLTRIGHPLGFFRSPVNSTWLYKSQLSWLIASSNVKTIICGTCSRSNPPGILVPSLEQKQSGRKHCDRSHEPTAFGSFWWSHQPSSDPSRQSTLPSQKYSCGKQPPSAQPSSPSGQSALANSGLGARSSAMESEWTVVQTDL